MLIGVEASRGESQALRVTLASGESESYALDERPRVRFTEGMMEICSTVLEASYPRSEVRYMDFTPVTTAVGTLEEETVRYVFRDNVFECEGHGIKVYDLSGSCVGAGTGSVSLQQLPEGIYIINVNEKSIKVIKK